MYLAGPFMIQLLRLRCRHTKWHVVVVTRVCVAVYPSRRFDRFAVQYKTLRNCQSQLIPGEECLLHRWCQEWTHALVILL